MTDPSVPSAPVPWRASVVLDFARSELFDRTFEEGMELVEETAAYLDGSGRQDSKLLPRGAALAYAAESMRLTTRLMQRAVREGEMKAGDACDARYRLGAQEVSRAAPAEGAGELPNGLQTLLERSERLYERVVHLDRRMYVEQGDEAAPNPVLSQFGKLLAAFG